MAPLILFVCVGAFILSAKLRRRAKQGGPPTKLGGGAQGGLQNLLLPSTVSSSMGDSVGQEDLSSCIAPGKEPGSLGKVHSSLSMLNYSLQLVHLTNPVFSA